MKPIDRLRGTCGTVSCVHCMHSYGYSGPIYGCGLDRARKGGTTWEDTCCTEDDWRTCPYNKPEPVYEYMWRIHMHSPEETVVTDGYYALKEIDDMANKNFPTGSGWTIVHGTGRARIE